MSGDECSLPGRGPQLKLNGGHFCLALGLDIPGNNMAVALLVKRGGATHLVTAAAFIPAALVSAAVDVVVSSAFVETHRGASNRRC